MTNEEMQKYGKESMETMMSSFGAWSKNAQAIAVELTDFSKKSIEGSAAAWERLMGAKTLEKAMEVQSEYLKSSYEDFVAEATKLSELYSDLAKGILQAVRGRDRQGHDDEVSGDELCGNEPCGDQVSTIPRAPAPVARSRYRATWTFETRTVQATSTR